MHMETVRTLAPHYRTVVPGERAVRAAAIEEVPADATRIVVGYPVPCCNCSPSFDFYFHGSSENAELTSNGGLNNWPNK